MAFMGGGEGAGGLEEVETLALGEALPPLNARLPRKVKSFFLTNDTSDTKNLC